MKHPSWPFIFAAFVPGVLFGRAFGGFLLAVGVVCLWTLGGFLLRRLARYGTWWLLGCILLTGWCVGGWKFERLSAAQAELSSIEGRRVGFACWVDGNAKAKVLREGEECWEFEALRGRLAGASSDLPGRVKVSWFVPRGVGEFAPKRGEFWSGTARLKVWKDGRIFVSCGSRDFRRAEVPEDVPLGILAERWQEIFDQRLQLGIRERQPEGALLSAMVLGRRGVMPAQENRLFRNTGTSHVFAVSGQHVVIVAGLFAGVLAVCGMSRRWMGLVLIPLVAGYTWLTGGSPSAVRACVMSGLFLGALLVRRRSSLADALLMTGVLVYAFYPLEGVEIGWQLSFGVMVGFVYVLPLLRWGLEWGLRRRDVGVSSRLTAALRFWLSADEARMDEGLLRAAHGQAEFREQVWLFMRRGARWVFLLLQCSVVAWLSTLPLVLFYFGRVSVAGILVNVPISLLAGLVLMSGVCGCLLGFVWHGGAIVVNGWAADLMGVMVRVVRWADGVQGELVVWDGFPMWGIVAYYGVLMGVYGWIVSRRAYQDRVEEERNAVPNG